MAGIDPREREREEIERKYALKSAMIGSKMCGRCWLQTAWCICSCASKFQDVACDPPQGMPIDVILYSHVDEFMRKSNTGSLLHLCSPLVRTHLLVCGRSDDEHRLEELLEARKGKACVVYPSDDATPVESFLEQQHDTAGASGMTFILLEGTWRQARKMEKRVRSDIPRVAIPPMEGGADGRMNTIMAFGEVVLKMPMGTEVKKSLLKRMDQLMKAKQDALFEIHGRHGTNTENSRRRRFPQERDAAYSKWELL